MSKPSSLSAEQLRFIQASPIAPSDEDKAAYRAGNLRENVVALKTQVAIHELLYGPHHQQLAHWRDQLLRLQGLAYAGYHPSLAELKLLIETVPTGLEEEVRDPLSTILNTAITQHDKWTRAGYNQEELRQHQDLEAIAEIASVLAEERIVVFGSSRLHEGSPEYEGTRWLMKTLVKELAHKDGTTEQVITGGGPGIMEAANRGAMEGAWEQWQALLNEFSESNEDISVLEKMTAFRRQMQSIGVGIIVPHEQSWNPYMQAHLTIKGFSPRKVGLVSIAAGRSIKTPREVQKNGNGKRKPAIIVMPGGYGTMDELWEVGTLEQCGKMPKIPILVVGAMVPIVQFAIKIFSTLGTIKPEDAELFTFCHDEVEALEEYLKHYQVPQTEGIQQAIFERRLAKKQEPASKLSMDISEVMAELKKFA